VEEEEEEEALARPASPFGSLFTRKPAPKAAVEEEEEEEEAPARPASPFAGLFGGPKPAAAKAAPAEEEEEEEPRFGTGIFSFGTRSIKVRPPRPAYALVPAFRGPALPRCWPLQSRACRAAPRQSLRC
jgi:hypothetical protein